MLSSDLRTGLNSLSTPQYAQWAMSKRPLWVFGVCMSASAQPRYGLLLKGGHVLDAKNGINAVRDVAIANGRIAAVAQYIPAAEERRTMDVNIVGKGMAGRTDIEQDVAEMAKQHKDLVVGIKIAHYAGPDLIGALAAALWLSGEPDAILPALMGRMPQNDLN